MPSDKVRIILPSPRFTVFDTERDGLPAIIVVNQTLLTFEHRDIFPWHLRVTIEARDLAEKGMPTSEESRRLFEIGDEIQSIVEGGRTEHGSENALHLARETWNGLRQLRFVVHNPEITHTGLQTHLNSREWSRPWEYHMAADSDWTEASIFFRLFATAKRKDQVETKAPKVDD